jgi:hypothetical protein
MSEFSERRFRAKKVEESDLTLLRRAEREDLATSTTRPMRTQKQFAEELKRIGEELHDAIAALSSKKKGRGQKK